MQTQTTILDGMAYATEQDYQRGIITTFVNIDGNMQPHSKIYRSKIIEGDDLIIKKEIE